MAAQDYQTLYLELQKEYDEFLESSQALEGALEKEVEQLTHKNRILQKHFDEKQNELDNVKLLLRNTQDKISQMEHISDPENIPDSYKKNIRMLENVNEELENTVRSHEFLMEQLQQKIDQLTEDIVIAETENETLKDSLRNAETELQETKEDLTNLQAKGLGMNTAMETDGDMSPTFAIFEQSHYRELEQLKTALNQLYDTALKHERGDVFDEPAFQEIDFHPLSLSSSEIRPSWMIDCASRILTVLATRPRNNTNDSSVERMHRSPSSSTLVEDHMAVICRIRPRLASESEQSVSVRDTDAQHISCYSAESDQWFPLAFDHVLGSQTQQVDLTDCVAQYGFVDSLLQGEHVGILALGASKSGKSYSLEGKMGITSCLIHELTGALNKAHSRTVVRVTMIYITNTKVHDLLIHQQQNVIVENDSGYHWVECNDETSVENVLQSGREERFSLESKNIFGTTIVIVHGESCGRLYLVDTLGFGGKGSASESSMAPLAEVFDGLCGSNRSHYIPYEKSALTQALQPIFESTNRIIVVTHVSPCLIPSHETYWTLHVASLARNCTLHNGSRRTFSFPKKLGKLDDTIRNLRMQKQEAESRVVQLVREMKTLKHTLESEYAMDMTLAE